MFTQSHSATSPQDKDHCELPDLTQEELGVIGTDMLPLACLPLLGTGYSVMGDLPPLSQVSPGYPLAFPILKLYLFSAHSFGKKTAMKILSAAVPVAHFHAGRGLLLQALGY